MILKTLSQKTNAIEMNATLKQSFYLIPKDNQLFSYTKFPVKKINVAQILKLYKNRFLIILPNNCCDVAKLPLTNNERKLKTRELKHRRMPKALSQQ
jgi:hypothetical protein